MARLPKLKSDSDIQKQIKNRLEVQAGINHWGYDSIGSLVANTVSTEFARTHAQVRDVFKSLQLTHAVGTDLDFIAAEWTGNIVQRLTAKFARVKAADKNFYFFTSVGTFGTLNGGMDIALPSGTVISSSDPGNGTKVVYKTDKSYTLEKDKTVQYCSVVATTMGKAMNCGKNTLTQHKVAYKESQKNLLKCTNRFPVLNGSDGENDEDLRFRITQAYPSVTQNNFSKIRLLSLGVPGIEDVRVIDGYYGIGSVGVIAIGMDNETSPQLVDALQNQLNAVQSIGLKVIAAPGIKVYFDFDLRIVTGTPISLGEEQIIRNKIRKQLFSIMKDQEFGRTFNFKSIGSLLLQAVPEVMSLKGVTGKLDHFQHVYYRKNLDTSDLPVERKEIIKNSFSIGKDEFIGLGTVDFHFEVHV